MVKSGPSWASSCLKLVYGSFESSGAPSGSVGEWIGAAVPRVSWYFRPYTHVLRASIAPLLCCRPVRAGWGEGDTAILGDDPQPFEQARQRALTGAPAALGLGRADRVIPRRRGRPSACVIPSSLRTERTRSGDSAPFRSGATASVAGAAVSSPSGPRRCWPVNDCGMAATSSGVPVAMTRPGAVQATLGAQVNEVGRRS